MKKDVSIATHSAIIPLQSSCFMHGLLREGQSLLKITSLPKCNYRNSDHPKKELIPTGIHLANISFFNTTRQSFYSRNPNLIEVYDLESDLVLYDLVHNTVITDPRFNGPASFETFPAWAPDGKRLYYCTAPARQLPKRLKEIKYSICSVSFNPDNGSFGETIDTIYTAHNKSASFPRISPDNQYLLFTESDYATFPIWHKEADLKMISLQGSAPVDTDILNSTDVESYHSWSSNGRWIIFSSRRLDGLYTRFFIAHLNENGKFSKPFLLPQKDPDENNLRMKSFNIPEFIKDKITITRSQLDHTVTD